MVNFVVVVAFYAVILPIALTVGVVPGERGTLLVCCVA